MEKLSAAMSSIRIGNGMEPGVTQGPMINTRAVEKIQNLVSGIKFGKVKNDMAIERCIRVMFQKSLSLIFVYLGEGCSG